VERLKKLNRLLQVRPRPYRLATVVYSTVQYNTVQCSSVQPGSSQGWYPPLENAQWALVVHGRGGVSNLWRTEY